MLREKCYMNYGQNSLQNSLYLTLAFCSELNFQMIFILSFKFWLQTIWQFCNTSDAIDPICVRLIAYLKYIQYLIYFGFHSLVYDSFFRKYVTWSHQPNSWTGPYVIDPQTHKMQNCPGWNTNSVCNHARNDIENLAWRDNDSSCWMCLLDILFMAKERNAGRIS